MVRARSLPPETWKRKPRAQGRAGALPDVLHDALPGALPGALPCALLGGPAKLL
jgi:hypothetical protein